MSSRRLEQGGRIDRSKPLTFTYNGREMRGFQGDTLASALLANGVEIVGRSFKYHRPRGIVGCGPEEPNAILQVGKGATTLPNQRATQVELYDRLSARNVNGWPSVEFDVMAVIGFFSRLLAAGFYYKTFMWPASKWDFYEQRIRRSAGWGTVPEGPDPHHYEHHNAHCDVLVVGAGPAGLAAALAAGRTGARVILCDEQNEMGGRLLSGTAGIDGASSADWIAATLVELSEMPDVTILVRATAFGHYDGNFVGILVRESDHFSEQLETGAIRQRIWRVRAKRVVHAQGAFERPLVFGNNDRPGIMMASAVSSYINRYAVVPGSSAVLFTNNDGAYQTALDMRGAGVKVRCVIDSRADGAGIVANAVRAKGIEVLNGHVVVDTRGRKRLAQVSVMQLAASGKSVIGGVRKFDCDLLAMSGGWSPAVHLHSHAGGKNDWDDAKACFVPGASTQDAASVGAGNGTFALADCIAEGLEQGAVAAKYSGHGDGRAPPTPAVDTVNKLPLVPLWRVPSRRSIERGPKQFVDFQNDTSSSDIALAVREGYRSVEHVKRYTALGFGTDQGKLGNINGMAILAGILGSTIADTGTTTFRPAYTPVTFGAGAGREIGPQLFEPVRKTAIHAWHQAHGAEFEIVGQWHRPWYYPKPGEDLHSAVNRECLAVREGVGILDASTLGKIDIQGPDAAEFLNRIYSNAWLKLKPGYCRYGLMLGEDGMVMDDGVTAHIGENHYHMTTTTGGAARVLGWMELWLQTEWPEMKVRFTSVTDHWATIAVAGPKSRALLEELCRDIDFSDDAFGFMTFKDGTIDGLPVRVFRISFTGELSFEINVDANFGQAVWDRVWRVGRAHGITPYGTETMHVLRAEKGFVIVGQDTDGSVTPIDLGMQWAVKDSADFLGRRSLARSDCVRTGRKQLVGLKTLDPNVVLPEGAQLVDDPDHRQPVPMIGHVTSSYYSANLGHSIAMALVKGGHGRSGDVIKAPLADGSVVEAEICSPIFFDANNERQKA